VEAGGQQNVEYTFTFRPTDEGLGTGQYFWFVRVEEQVGVEWVPVAESEVRLLYVSAPPTPTPTRLPPISTRRPTNTPLAAATPLGPLEMSIPSILPGSCWSDPNTGRWGATLVWIAWGGNGVYEYYADDLKPEFKLLAPSYDFSSQVNHRWPGSLYTVSGGESVKRNRWVEPSECGY